MAETSQIKSKPELGASPARVNNENFGSPDNVATRVQFNSGGNLWLDMFASLKDPIVVGIFCILTGLLVIVSFI